MPDGCRASLGDVIVGEGLPVAVMGVINVSPESFHRGSVRVSEDEILATALAMVDAGAALVDVGARSTAPYLETAITEETERARLGRAVEILARKIPVPISADTVRAGPARAALEAGARIINDVSGLRDSRMARLIAEHRASAILMASPADVAGLSGSSATNDRHPDLGADEPLTTVREHLSESLARASAAAIPVERLVLDPGIGFFRAVSVSWDEWDLRVLAGLASLKGLGRPLAVGVSRKSFIGAITGRRAPAERLAGSLAATTIAVLHGAALVRTHDVAETVDAVRVAERLRRIEALST